MAAPVTPAAPVAKVSAADIAKDITKFGAPAVAILEIIENVVPSVTPSTGLQAIIAAVVGVLTLLLSVNKQQAVAAASAK